LGPSGQKKKTNKKDIKGRKNMAGFGKREKRELRKKEDWKTLGSRARGAINLCHQERIGARRGPRRLRWETGVA